MFSLPEVSPVSKRVVYLTDEQWKKIEPLFPSLLLDRKEVAPERITDWFSRESSGYSRREPGGKIFLTSTQTRRPAGVS
jgi:hypothetical protein